MYKIALQTTYFYPPEYPFLKETYKYILFLFPTNILLHNNSLLIAYLIIL